MQTVQLCQSGRLSDLALDGMPSRTGAGEHGSSGSDWKLLKSMADGYPFVEVVPAWPDGGSAEG